MMLSGSVGFVGEGKSFFSMSLFAVLMWTGIEVRRLSKSTFDLFVMTPKEYLLTQQLFLR
jgi:pantothenate kinase-related protein Tda10